MLTRDDFALHASNKVRCRKSGFHLSLDRYARDHCSDSRAPSPLSTELTSPQDLFRPIGSVPMISVHEVLPVDPAKPEVVQTRFLKRWPKCAALTQALV